MGTGTHFTVAGGELGEVENEDWVAALVEFETGLVGTIESSRVAVGPEARYAFEANGTEGAVSWNFERMNELEVCLPLPSGDRGYSTVYMSPNHPDFAHFQPGPGLPMGYNDLKVIEAYLFLESIVDGVQRTPGVAGDGCRRSSARRDRAVCRVTGLGGSRRRQRATAAVGRRHRTTAQRRGVTMVQTMPAAVFAGEGLLDITERPRPSCSAPDDVVLAVEVCGICGTDLKILERPQAHPATPGVILGHEILGSRGREPGPRLASNLVIVSS